MIENGDGAATRRELAVLRERVEERWAGTAREQALRDVAFQRFSDALTARLESMNEFRAQILSERGAYATREMTTAQLAALEAKVTRVERSEANLQGRLAALGVLLSIGLTGAILLVEMLIRRGG